VVLQNFVYNFENESHFILGSIHTCIQADHVQWISEALSLEVNRLGREGRHSSVSSAEVKNAWSSMLG
jgi:hypothetical protein